MYWLQDTNGGLTPPLFADSGDVADATAAGDVYLTDFSSREHAGQDLDVLAPGSWIRGPFAGFPGYNLDGRAACVGGRGPGLREGRQPEPDRHRDALRVDGAADRRRESPGLGSIPRHPRLSTVSWGADAAGEGLLQIDEAHAQLP